MGVSPVAAERIIREFYGLPGAPEQTKAAEPAQEPEDLLDLSTLLEL